MTVTWSCGTLSSTPPQGATTPRNSLSPWTNVVDDCAVSRNTLERENNSHSAI